MSKGTMEATPHPGPLPGRGGEGVEAGTIVTRDPGELTVHPLAKALPDWERKDPRFEAFLEDLRERGQDRPLLIDKENKILVGRKLWRAAKLLQWPEVECKIVGEQDAASAILGNLVHRKHYTKGALAYVAFPLMQPAWEEARRRKLEMLKKGNKSPSSAEWTTGKTVEGFSDSVGIGRSLFFQAREIHGLFQKHPTLKPEFEPKILDGEIGLGACIAGIAGKLATDGQARGNPEQLELFERGLDLLDRRLSFWGSWDTKQREAAWHRMEATFVNMHEDLQRRVANLLAAGKRRAA